MNELQFNTLRMLTSDGTLSQRDLSRKMGISLGKVNYIVNELLEKGYIKAERFKNSKNKMAYMYILTPHGVAEKFRQTQAFIRRKTEEYERLGTEIESLRSEHADLRSKEKSAVNE
ncbi:MAG: MarR family EPS-associated transcriptional regulator [Nitrospirae bacterium]|nr:MarR family EPS-associated transcriptional regulator [Nitrospirota bacterium]